MNALAKLKQWWQFASNRKRLVAVAIAGFVLGFVLGAAVL